MEILPQLPPPPPPPPPPPSPLLRTCGERHRPRELRSRGGGLGSQAVPPSASLAVAAAKSCHWEKDGAVTCLPRPRRGGRGTPRALRGADPGRSISVGSPLRRRPGGSFSPR
ncbi:E3 ubiquitin-protein ligase MARCHF11-like isoform X1 [Artibeus jamaicensis]|uniref:E3 ubiquitin-protein ligase MARCHF11-like isoform X1 n=1 Tax=Artibeus jamaicensis TaxID=9417 RepID=UPI00235B22F2|nr:E3 ubiquitin-protein ligase MARCHF11-like isoform X1 [Artibeus jamaicensis]